MVPSLIGAVVATSLVVFVVALLLLALDFEWKLIGILMHSQRKIKDDKEDKF